MRFKTKNIGDEGLPIRLSVTGPWLSAECPDIDIQPGPQGLSLKGHLDRNEDSFLLRADLRGSLVTPCARCLEPAIVALDIPLTAVYEEVDEKRLGKVAAPDDEEDEEDGEIQHFSGGELDLGPQIRDEILMALPIGPLCREDCLGICSVCGGNRNVNPCPCEEKQRQEQSKFSALKALKV